ncbi:MAG: hypothetical protein ACON4H_06305 [Rubripirellula sp.]
MTGFLGCRSVSSAKEVSTIHLSRVSVLDVASAGNGRADWYGSGVAENLVVG